jgi:hypothetical protein
MKIYKFYIVAFATMFFLVLNAQSNDKYSKISLNYIQATTMMLPKIQTEKEFNL